MRLVTLPAWDRDRPPVVVEVWSGRLRGRFANLSGVPLLFVLITMTLILLLAGLVAAYAAFTHRGVQVPAVPWVGDALDRAASRVPTLPGDQQQGRR